MGDRPREPFGGPDLTTVRGAPSGALLFRAVFALVESAGVCKAGLI